MGDDLLHIRVGKEIKKKMKELIDAGLFTNQAEIAREAIRNLILRYDERISVKEGKKEKDETHK